MKIAAQILTAAALAAFGAGSALAQTVGFATGPQATPTNAAGAAVAKIANELGGLQTRAVPHTSNEVSLAPLNRGQVEFAISNVDVTAAALLGVDVFDGRKHSNLRVAVQPPFYVPVICGFTKHVSGTGGRMPRA